MKDNCNEIQVQHEAHPDLKPVDPRGNAAPNTFTIADQWGTFDVSSGKSEPPQF